MNGRKNATNSTDFTKAFHEICLIRGAWLPLLPIINPDASTQSEVGCKPCALCFSADNNNLDSLRLVERFDQSVSGKLLPRGVRLQPLRGKRSADAGDYGISPIRLDRLFHIL
jgi:hypothetical protein